MSHGTDHILTSHAGSLPRPDELIEINRRRMDKEDVDDSAYQELLHGATVDVVSRQAEIGLDIPNDGEYAHEMGTKVDYAAWINYSYPRFSGIGEWTAWDDVEAAPPKSGIQLAPWPKRRDYNRFAEAFADPDYGLSPKAKVAQGEPEVGWMVPVVTEKLEYTGHEAISRDIQNMKDAMQRAGVERGFLNSVGPGSWARIGNRFYDTDEEFIWAAAEALREEYLAITNAGLTVQIDEPSFSSNWDQFDPEPSLADYRAFTMIRIEALNHALRGIPQELTRFHGCWGSNRGPHTTDIELKDMVDLLLKVDCGEYQMEAGNVRHEHDWKVWQHTKLPEGKVLVPGVVSHKTSVVEHPELVADRLEVFANLVGRENVIAATDCGLGGRLHPTIAWAKLEVLVEGARLATERVWKKTPAAV
jgi:5-methyltetrahydropteroyltriglutamate--homocysteine methyltransferase